ELSQRLVEVPTIGPIGATLMAMKVTNPHAFRCGRDFAAWLGLTPKDHSTAGKTRLGVITRAGDEELRSVLVAGATAVIQQAQKGRGFSPPWLVDLLKRKHAKLAAVALANKMVRVAWKLMVSGERDNPARFAAQPATPTREGAALRCVRLRAAPPRSASRLGAEATRTKAQRVWRESDALPHAEAGACLRRSRWL